MDYEQLEPPFEYDGNDYETAQSVYLDEPAYDWRTRAEAAESLLEDLQDTVRDVRNALNVLSQSPALTNRVAGRMIGQYASELTEALER